MPPETKSKGLQFLELWVGCGEHLKGSLVIPGWDPRDGAQDPMGWGAQLNRGILGTGDPMGGEHSAEQSKDFKGGSANEAQGSMANQ